jgi:hypothetical protein
LKIGIALRKLGTLEIAHLPSFPKDCCTEDFEAVLRFMKDNLNIRKISIKHFIGGGPKLKILCKILILIKKQGIIFFKSCRVHKGGWASFIGSVLEGISEALQKSKLLKTLNLKVNNLSDSGSFILAEILKVNQSLKQVDEHQNKIIAFSRGCLEKYHPHRVQNLYYQS